MAAPPRPYDVGPYGTGYYSRYRASVYELAAATCVRFNVVQRGVPLTRQISLATTLRFGARAATYRVIGYHGVSEIVFGAVGHADGIYRVVQPAAATSIHFGATWAPNVVINREAEASISFSTVAVMAPAWGALAPCEAGAWGAEAAEVGTWAIAGPCVIGTWVGQLP